MKRSIYHRGCVISNYNHEENKQEFLIITPIKTFIVLEDAVTFEQCKLWIDRQFAKCAIEKAFR